VAGTNGKGSTVAFLESILLTAGYSVGAYTSPHLLMFNERIRINNKQVSDLELVQVFSEIEKARAEEVLTYFEFTTLAALVLFSENKNKLDVILLEVGLGGRLDATNIIDPDLSIITTVDIDHQAWLGADKESIAREKAGIMRSEVPVIYGDTKIPAVIKDLSLKLNAPLYVYAENYSVSSNPVGWNWTAAGNVRSGLPFPALLGEQQLKNAATALMALELLKQKLPVSQQAIKSGLLAAKIAGRFQVIGQRPQIIFDVAHNPQATSALAETLLQHSWSGRTLAVAGLLRDKDIDQTLLPMQPVVDEWFLADLTGESNSRGSTATALRDALILINNNVRTTTWGSPMAAYNAVLENTQADDRIIVFGSFSTVGGILASIQ
jgi:dihydrofolate synthase/folylpolyglutamate synthase